MIVLAALGAPQRRLFGRRAPKRVSSEPDPMAVSTTRATVIDTHAFEGNDEAAAWLKNVDLVAASKRDLETLNRVLYAQRIAAANPFVHEVSIDEAIAIRAGIGIGYQVADGRWEDALELGPPAPGESLIRRPSTAGSQERVAALLGARDVALATEELALRARLDLDQGRELAALLGIRLTLEAAIHELTPVEYLQERVAELVELQKGASDAAAAALTATLTDEQRVDAGHALRRVEAALRARTAPRR